MSKKTKYVVVLRVRNKSTRREWDEKYDPENLTDPDHVGRTPRNFREIARSQEEAADWGRRIIAAFNATRPENSPARELVSVHYRPLEEVQDPA